VALCVLSIAASAFAQPEPRPKRRGRKYKVKVDSAPQQAAVYLDDEKYGIVGYTPWDGRLEKGEWKVIIKKDGYETATRVLTVKRRRRTQEIFVPMIKKDEPGTVEVTAAADQNAFGAEVWVDGQLQGTLPVLATVPEGRHLVEVKKENYATFSQWVDVKQGQQVTLAPVLKPNKVVAKGALLVDADVADAEVLVDGQAWKDKTPTVIPDLDEGVHIVEVRKPPAMPWKQTVVVKAGETVKVTAGLQATAGGPTGTVRVISNVEGAEVYVDGTRYGVVPIDIKDLTPGEHVIELKATGFRDRKQNVTVSAGSAEVLDLELQPAAELAKSATIKVVSAIPEASVVINGERLGPAPQEKKVEPGKHPVLVEKPGFRPFTQEVAVGANETVTVNAELIAAGTLRVLSTPTGANVFLDGEAVGTTPLKLDDVEAGEHVITLQLEDYYNFEQNFTITGGDTEIVNAQMRKIDIGPTAAEVAKQQRSLTSFSARTLPRGKSTIDVGIGYPHYLNARINVGAGDVAGFGFDAGVGFRTFFSRTELLLHGRMRLVEAEPFAAGVFASIGGGSSFYDDSQRNTFALDAGGAVSLFALNRVTVTGRMWLNFWSDRLCPGLNSDQTGFRDVQRSDGISICRDVLDDLNNTGTPDQARVGRAVDLVDGGTDLSEVFERDNGARLMMGLTIEIAIQQKINAFLIFEGSPFGAERAAFTDVFNTTMLEDDPETYIQLGATYKF